MRTRRAVLLGCIFLASASALAAPNAADVQAYNDAGAQLSTLIAQAEAVGGPKALHTAKEMDLVRRFADEDRMLGEPVGDLAAIGDICGLANRISVSLMLFGAKARIDPHATPEQTTAVLVPLMQENSLQFQGELEEVQPFVLRCMAKQIPALESFVAGLKPDQMTDVRRDGLSKMRSGLLGVFTGTFNAVPDQRYQASYRLALATALDESAGEFVKLTQVPARKPIADGAAQVAVSMPSPYKEHLQSIASAFGNQACGALCSVP